MAATRTIAESFTSKLNDNSRGELRSERLMGALRHRGAEAYGSRDRLDIAGRTVDHPRCQRKADKRGVRWGGLRGQTKGRKELIRSWR